MAKPGDVLYLVSEEEEDHGTDVVCPLALYTTEAAAQEAVRAWADQHEWEDEDGELPAWCACCGKDRTVDKITVEG